MATVSLPWPSKAGFFMEESSLVVLRNRPNHLDNNLAVARIERDLAVVLEHELEALDHNAPDCLALALDVLDKAGIERQRTAGHLGVGTTTVSRWASKEIVPRATAFRKAMLAGMRELMAEVLNEYEVRVRRLEGHRPKGPAKSPAARTPGP